MHGIGQKRAVLPGYWGMRALTLVLGLAALLAGVTSRAEDGAAGKRASATGAAAVAPAAKAPVGLPIPSPSGKALASSPSQRVFRVPLSFAQVERFYRGQLGAAAGVTLTLERRTEGRTLTLTSRREGDAWSRAVVRENTVDTTVEVTPMVRAGVVSVDAQVPRPAVQFVLPPNPEVHRQAATIDHLQPPRE